MLRALGEYNVASLSIEALVLVAARCLATARVPLASTHRAPRASERRPDAAAQRARLSLAASAGPLHRLGAEMEPGPKTRRIRRNVQRWAAIASAWATLTCAPVAQGPGQTLVGHAHFPVASTPAGAVTAPSPTAAPDHIVLVTSDGVRWEDVFNAGDELPNLTRLRSRHGVAIGAPGSGSEIRASGPAYISLPGYRELLLGSEPLDCQSNACGPPRVPGLPEQLGDSAPGGAAVFASWPGVGSALARTSHAVVSIGKRDLEGSSVLDNLGLRRAWESGRDASPKPGWGQYRADPYTASLALKYLERRRPRFMFVSLGDTDEYGHQANRAGYMAALKRFDGFVGQLADELRRLEEVGRRTLLVVTTDHGRADDFSKHGGAHPESARVWLIASGTAIQARGDIPSPKPRRLRDVAPTLLLAAGEPSSASHDGEPLLELFQR